METFCGGICVLTHYSIVPRWHRSARLNMNEACGKATYAQSLIEAFTSLSLLPAHTDYC